MVIVQIELLATVVWKRGCQPFSCRCSLHVMHCQKEIYATCLSKESVPAIPFGNCNHPTLPEATASCLSLHCSFRKKPVPRREAEGLVTELWSPRYVTILWLCSQLCYETAANQRTLVQIELLATVSWKWGCRPFSYLCSQNVTHCRKEMNATSLSTQSMFLWKSKPPLGLSRKFRIFLNLASSSLLVCKAWS